MGKTEKCNGDPIRRFGDEYSFFEIAIENIAEMNKYSFDKVVTPATLSSHIGKEYAKFEDGILRQYIALSYWLSLLSGKIIPGKM